MWSNTICQSCVMYCRWSFQSAWQTVHPFQCITVLLWHSDVGSWVPHPLRGLHCKPSGVLILVGRLVINNLNCRGTYSTFTSVKTPSKESRLHSELPLMGQCITWFQNYWSCTSLVCSTVYTQNEGNCIIKLVCKVIHTEVISSNSTLQYGFQACTVS